MNMTNKDPYIRKTLEILADEVRGDVSAAFKKMHPDYSMTWVYKNLPKVHGKKLRRLMEKAYAIKDRKYDIKHIARDKNTIMIELVETYGKYQTPLVLVLDFEKGKIRRGRHYCDPGLNQASKKGLKRIYE